MLLGVPDVQQWVQAQPPVRAAVSALAWLSDLLVPASVTAYWFYLHAAIAGSVLNRGKRGFVQ
jgi:hypothetical protein